MSALFCPIYSPDYCSHMLQTSKITVFCQDLKIIKVLKISNFLGWLFNNVKFMCLFQNYKYKISLSWNTTHFLSVPCLDFGFYKCSFCPLCSFWVQYNHIFLFCIYISIFHETKTHETWVSVSHLVVYIG